MDTPKPIGYWLKHLHNLLETQFSLVLAELSHSRRHWQLLNTLSRGPHSRDELRRALAPFWTDGEPDLDEVLDGAAAHGWTRETGDVVTLTDQGRATHAAAGARIEQTRAVVVDGLKPEQYTETVRVLSVMARNVEADIAARSLLTSTEADAAYR